jgi:hypothetical protein
MSDARTTYVAVTGVAPGVGTSTLVDAIRQWLVSRGLSVEVVEEDEFLTRPEFARAARELAVTGTVHIDTLIECVGIFVAGIKKSPADVVMSDSILPLVHSLMEWGAGENAIDGFLNAVTEQLDGVPFTLVYLDADVQGALRQAAVREPAGWLDWYVTNLLSREPISTMSREDLAVACLERERELALRLIGEHGWNVVRLADADLLDIPEVFDRARIALEPSLAHALVRD